jgi:nitrogen regulatory protein P-II 1
MVKVEAVIRPDRFEQVRDGLQKIGIKGMSVSELMGCGRQQGYTERYRGTEYVMNLLPKMRVEAVVSEDQLDAVIETIVEAARTGEVGDGKVFVLPVLDVVRIRTGERGTDAL